MIDNNLNSCNCSQGGMGHGASVEVNMYIYYNDIKIEIFHQSKISHFTLVDQKYV